MPSVRWITLISIGLLSMATAMLIGCPPANYPPAGRGTRVAPPGDRIAPPPPGTPTIHEMPVAQVRSEPLVRVRLSASITGVTIDRPRQLLLYAGTSAQRSTGRIMNAPLEVRRDGQRILVHTQGAGGSWLAYTTDRLFIEPVGSASIGPRGGLYPGVLAIDRPDKPRDRTDNFDLINHVGIESYLPGVLEGELYASWHAQMYRAQAIAARSYAVAHLRASRDRDYDVENTVASQVYKGATDNPRVLSAVRDTGGMMLVWEGKVIPAYFSSCCGGAGQDAYQILDGAPNIPPLLGRYHGGWCAASPYYSWGPITRSRTTLARRLAAWGRANKHAIAELSSLGNIAVAARGGGDRPVRFTVVDGSGRSYSMDAEDFRFACNTSAGGLPAPASADQLKSGFVKVRVEGASVFFYDGHGFGHGAGMCQWGAQAMARKGYEYASILAFYYPGARIDKLY